MALHGSAFMILWHDITSEGEAEYHHWHSRQHMPERMDHTGFLRSRRGVNWAYDRQRYFTLYECETLDDLLSDEYAKSLNYPTEWTSRVAPTFRNFLRMACTVDRTMGRGVGGALCTVRGNLPAGMDEAGFREAIEGQLSELADMPLVCGVHLAVARENYSNGRTRETELRPPMAEKPFEFVLIVESFGLRELEEILPATQKILADAGCASLVGQSYDMAYTITEDAR